MNFIERKQPIGSCGMSEGFSSCQLSGVIAQALLKDLKTNNFTFSNFPEVSIDWDDTNFLITLLINGISSSTLLLSRKKAKEEVKKFKNNQELSGDIFNNIQNLVAELEAKVSNTSIT